jgi:hypothetical protein
MLNKRKTLLRFSLASLVCLANFFVRPLVASQAQLTLSNGWNLVSLPLQPTDTNIQSALAPIQGQYQSVWTYSDGRWYGFNPSVPGLDDLKYMQAGKAYWIQMRQDGVLTLNGLSAVNAPNTFEGQDLLPGWNLLGYSSGRSEDIKEAFAPIAGHLDLAAAHSGTGWFWYRPGNPSASTLGSLPPFQGIWAHVNAKSTWIGPNYQGTVVDAVTGKPVVGATVSLDGIEAEAPTDAQGTFIITGLSDGSSQILTVIAKGYRPLATNINPPSANSPGVAKLPTKASVDTASQSTTFSLTPSPSPFVAEVLVPQNNSVWIQR